MEGEVLTKCETAEHHVSTFCRMQKICQTFRNIFESTPCLLSTVLIRNGMETNNLPAMLKWFHKHGHVVETLVAHCGSLWLDVALGSLLSSNLHAGVQTSLTKAFVCNITATTIDVLCHFDHLVTLELRLASPDEDDDSPGQRVDLGPLQRLQHLTSLLLIQGQFVNLETLRHLSSLVVVSSEVDCEEDCQFVTSLRRLDVVCAYLEGFHSDGVSACTNLTSLHLNDVAIQGDNAAEDLVLQGNEQQQVPHSLTKLTALSHHTLMVANSCLGLANSHLSQHVTLRASSLLELSQGIRRLKRLTDLVVMAAAKVCFNWADLISLERRCIHGSLVFCQGVLDLANFKLQALTSVEFSEPQEYETCTALEMELLADALKAAKT